MAFTNDHKAVEQMARTLLFGQLLLGDNFREIGVSSLLFGSAISRNAPNVSLNITANTWFESDIISEKRCKEEHMVHDKYWGKHISWICPQFCQQVERYRDWKVTDVAVNGKTLVVTLDEKVRLFCNGDTEELDSGWAVGGTFGMHVAQAYDNSDIFASIPDEVQDLFGENWEWTRED